MITLVLSRGSCLPQIALKVKLILMNETIIPPYPILLKVVSLMVVMARLRTPSVLSVLGFHASVSQSFQQQFLFPPAVELFQTGATEIHAVSFGPDLPRFPLSANQDSRKMGRNEHSFNGTPFRSTSARSHVERGFLA